MANIFKSNMSKIISDLKKDIAEEYENFRKENHINIYRCGTYKRRLKTMAGEIVFDRPKYRKSFYENKIIEKYERCSEDFKLLVHSMIETFSSYDLVIDLIYQFLGIKIGHSTITKIKEMNRVDLDRKFNFSITDSYPYIFIDATYYKAKVLINTETSEYLNDDKNVGDELHLVIKSVDKAVYTAIGVDANGFKTLLAINVSNPETKIEWLTFLNNLKERGLKNPKIFVCDDFPGISKTIKQIFPSSMIQKFVIHKVRNAVNFVPKKYHKKFTFMLRRVYTSENRIDALSQFYYLKKGFETIAKQAIYIIESSLDEILTFLDAPIEIRRQIYTNNVSENFNCALRKYIKEKCSFTNERALYYLVLNASKRITRNWVNKSIPNIEY